MKYSKLYDVEMWKSRAAELTVLLRDTISCTKARQQEMERYRNEVARLQAENAKLRSRFEGTQSNGDSPRHASLQKPSINGVYPASDTSHGVTLHNENAELGSDGSQVERLKQEVADLKSRLEESKQHLGSERKLSNRWKAEAAVLRSKSSEDGFSSPGDSAKDDERLIELMREVNTLKSELSDAKQEVQRQARLRVESEKALRQEHEEKKQLLLEEVKAMHSQCDANRKIVHKLKSTIKAQSHVSSSSRPSTTTQPPAPTTSIAPRNDLVSLDEMKYFHSELLGLREMTSQVVGRMRELAAVK